MSADSVLRRRAGERLTVADYASYEGQSQGQIPARSRGQAISTRSAGTRRRPAPAQTRPRVRQLPRNAGHRRPRPAREPLAGRAVVLRLPRARRAVRILQPALRRRRRPTDDRVEGGREPNEERRVVSKAIRVDCQLARLSSVERARSRPASQRTRGFLLRNAPRSGRAARPKLPQP
jgi:hypothetical protein